MSALAKIWADLIDAELKKIEEVPADLKTEVEELLKEDNK